MAKKNDPYYPKNKAEFEAYVRAMNEANEMAIKSGTKKKTAKTSTNKK